MILTIKIELKEYIGNSDFTNLFATAIRLLNRSCNLFDELIAIKSRYSRIHRKELGNLLSNEEAELNYSKITKACLELIDRIQECDLSISFRKIYKIREDLKLKNNQSVALSRSDFTVIFEYIDELEERIDSDYKLFEIFDVHSIHKNQCSFFDSRDNSVDNEMTTIMDFEDCKSKYELRMVDLVNLDPKQRMEIINFLENNSKELFDSLKQDESHIRRYKGYAKLINDANQLIEKEVSHSNGKFDT